MSKRTMRINKRSFWSGFFFLLGFQVNPFLSKAKEIKSKTVDQRMGESWGRTADNFKVAYKKESCLVNEQ